MLADVCGEGNDEADAGQETVEVSAMLDLETDRVRLNEVVAEELPQLLPVLTSNSAFLQLTEGSAGEVGVYDLDRLQRDWTFAGWMPGRHVVGGYLKDTGQAIAYLDYLEENDDGFPWVGTLIIHARYQRQGLGSEILQALVEYGRAEHSWACLRTSALQTNTPALAFLAHLGFHSIGETLQTSPAGKSVALIFERPANELS